MNESPAENCHLYGSVHASDNSKLIIGDIQIHHPIFNISPLCHGDVVAAPCSTCLWQKSSSPKSADPHLSAPNSGTGVFRGPVSLGVCYRSGNSISKAERRAMEPHRNCENPDMAPLRGALVDAIIPSASSDQSTRKIEASAQGLEDVSEPVTDVRSCPARYGAWKSNTAHQMSKFAGISSRDTRWNDKSTPRASAGSPKTLAATVETSITFQDDLQKPCAFAREDSQYRIFLLSKQGQDWTQVTCTESLMPASEINERIKRGPARSRQRKQNIKRTLDRLDPRRRHASESLVQEVNRCDPYGYQWYIVAIDVENARWAKRVGDVAVFSVILAKTSDSLAPK